MRSRLVYLLSFAAISFVLTMPQHLQAKSYIAYISDSTNSSVIYWIAKEAGILKKHGLDLDLIFINGSVRGIQSLIAGDLSYSGAVGTAVINAKLAGADIAIIQSQMNTLPYFIIGNANIKSPEGLKGRSAAVHIPGTSADFAMRLALSKVGIPYSDIKAVTVGGAPARLAAVTNGQMDFTVVTDGERIQGEKMGLKVIIDMAKLNVPFQFNCSVTTRTKIRDNPDEVRRVVWSMAESIHFFKTRKEESIKIMQKYTRGLPRHVLEGAHAANSELLVEDTYPTLDGLKNTLEVQAATDPRAAKFKAEDMVELRFVDEMRKSGFVDKLYGRKK
ncbi:MAG TPA: ABC transporter substrate-binding protein [Candidatus Polarisedimenticolaceae bacterium]|nr:ABC transporter substrate-binding protein [Candidatus Polarisedimenticolaceae bacterium]